MSTMRSTKGPAGTAKDPMPMLHLGLVVTVLVALAPVVDLLIVDSIKDHVRDAYPDWPASDVALDRNAIVIYLVSVGVLGVAGWLWTTWLQLRGSRRTRPVATTLFVLALLVALTTVSMGGEAYDTIVPTTYGVLGLVPVVIGAVALVRIWRQPARRTPEADQPSTGRPVRSGQRSG